MSDLIEPEKRRWRTPPTLFATFHAIYGFGLDAAAEDGAELCPPHITPAMDTLRTPWASVCERNRRGERVAWANFPSGSKSEGFAGTEAFTDRAIDQLSTLDGVVLLLPTAPDTRWWGACFEASVTVRLLPRIRFIDPDTGLVGESPPGAGYSVFTLWNGQRGRPHVVRCDVVGRVISGGVR